MPLVPFVFGLANAFGAAALLTGGVFFVIGSVKSRWPVVAWWRSGLVTLAVGSAAATLAYGAGVLLKALM